jgi:putative peptide zinc metalloprotease protein
VLELVLPDRRRVTLDGDLTIGRSPRSGINLADPSVSRLHSRISVGADGRVLLEDAGSSYGTWLDGRRVRGASPLRPGARIRVGDQELFVEAAPGEDDAGHTQIVPVEATAATRLPDHPRLRSGRALKRLAASEGERRWLLEDLRSGRFVRFADSDAEMLALLDGSRSLAELAAEAERRGGPDGPARLALLLAALADRGLLSGSAEEMPTRRRLPTVRSSWPGAGDLFEWLYRHGAGSVLGRPGLAAVAGLALAGLAAFACLVVGRYGTPFVVARKVGLGGVVFVTGRLAVAALHETAHGVVMASFGRRVREAGVKLVLIFPYVYVDTSEAWFEPRRHRIAVSAAGPASDLCVGGTFALCCLALGPGAVRDVLFQLAFGAYVGAFFNLNPGVERDGYAILADLLREPALRRKATEQLRRRIEGDRDAFTSRALARYARLVVGWSLLGAAIAAVLALRYATAFTRLLPSEVVWTLMVALWLVLLVPLAMLVGPPLWRRLRA